MSADPRVSVVLPVRNGARFLDLALQSVLAQTCRDWELIAVDDGSSDATPSMLTRCREVDRRLRVITQPTSGTAAALNRGIAAARGEFIARMDADDVAQPTRLARQLEWLGKRPEIAVLGTAARWIDPQGHTTEDAVIRYAKTPGSIRWQMCFGNALIHPTVMIRRSKMPPEPWYDESLPAAQDYDLWLRLLFDHQFANLAEPLLLLRRHPESVSSSQRDTQVGVSVSALAVALSTLLTQEIAAHDCRLVFGFQPLEDPNDAHRAVELLQAITRGCLSRPGNTLLDRRYLHRETARLIVRQASRCARLKQEDALGMFATALKWAPSGSFRYLLANAKDAWLARRKPSPP